jgi:hypothetical protein
MNDQFGLVRFNLHQDLIFASLKNNLHFSFSYPTWFVLLCLLIGFIYAFLLYHKKQNAYPKPFIFWIVAASRGLVVTILSFLLLSPVLRYIQNKEEKPTIAFLHDNSASQKYAFKKIDSIQYRKDIEKMLSDLKENYNVKEFSIGNQLRDSLHFTYTDQSTDLSSAMEMVMTTLENVNLSGMIVASDGIINKGVSPTSIHYPYKGVLYTIGVGDTAIKRDALVARVFANKVVYLGDQFAIRTDMAAYACKGLPLQVSVFSHQANRVVSNQNITITDDRFSKSIETIVQANSPGVHHYTITVSKVDGEQNIANNSQDVYIEVLDSKENVLLVGNAPHPDLYALKEALSKNKNYKVSTISADKVNASIHECNLLILHNLPSTKYPVLSLIDQAKKLGISIWYILGAQSNIAAVNQQQGALQISAKGMSMNDAQPVMHNDFSYFTMPNARDIQNLPPLSTPFADFKVGPDAQVFMQQKIGGITTQYPLWVLQQSSSSKVGVLAGEGIWRWRMYDFNQHKNHALVDDYILKVAQYLSVKQDKRMFRVTLPKHVFSESEPVVMDAELYNQSYELINTPDVSLRVIDENGKRLDYSMNKNSNAYSLQLGNLSPGKYAYSANTVFNGKSQNVTGNFTVVEENIEEVNTTADFGMLNQLAKNYGGEFLLPSQITSIAERIRTNPQIKTMLRSSVTNEPFINWKWLFLCLLLLLSLEWFLRKRSGNY